MSVDSLWADVYSRECKKNRTLRDRLCLEEIRVQQLESFRRTMLSLLTLAAKDLQSKNMPFGDTLATMTRELRDCYVEEFIGRPSEVEGAQTPDDRSARPLPNASLYASTGTDPFGLGPRTQEQR